MASKRKYESEFYSMQWNKTVKHWQILQIKCAINYVYSKNIVINRQ